MIPYNDFIKQISDEKLECYQQLADLGYTYVIESPLIQSDATEEVELTLEIWFQLRPKSPATKIRSRLPIKIPVKNGTVHFFIKKKVLDMLESYLGGSFRLAPMRRFQQGIQNLPYEQVNFFDRFFHTFGLDYYFGDLHKVIKQKLKERKIRSDDFNMDVQLMHKLCYALNDSEITIPYLEIKFKDLSALELEFRRDEKTQSVMIHGFQYNAFLNKLISALDGVSINFPDHESIWTEF